jgi:DNA-binding transcriptional MerR regulator
MFSIGTMSDRTGVKVPTIRYYEDMGLLAPAERTAGNQRRYDQAALDRLTFIRHARDLGFSIEAISELIALGEHPDQPCAGASRIARDQLADVRARLARLQRLEVELTRIVAGCSGDGTLDQCHVMAALADHDHCVTEH